jgi:hypothetical protein
MLLVGHRVQVKKKRLHTKTLSPPVRDWVEIFQMFNPEGIRGNHNPAYHDAAA